MTIVLRQLFLSEVLRSTVGRTQQLLCHPAPMSDRPAVVSILSYVEDLHEGEEFEATTMENVHYHFMKWCGRLWHRIWDDCAHSYCWVEYDGKS